MFFNQGFILIRRTNATFQFTFRWNHRLEYFARNLRADLIFTSCSRLITYRLSLLLYDHFATFIQLYIYVDTFYFHSARIDFAIGRKIQNNSEINTIRPTSHRLLSLACSFRLLVHRDPIIFPYNIPYYAERDVATSFAILLTNFCGKVSRNSVRWDTFMEIVSPLSCKFPL